MKIKLFSLGISLFLLTTFQINAQTCTPNPEYADEDFGVWPDTVTNLPCAYGNQASYEAVIDLKTLTDTLISIQGFEVRAYISAFRIHAVTGIPTNFSYTPNAEEWTNTGTAPNFESVQGCVSINATQTAVQAALNGQPAVDFPIVVRVDAKIHSTNPSLAPFFDVNNKWLSEIAVPGVEPIPVTGYKVKVRTNDNNGCTELPSSVSELNKLPFKIEGNVPNPFYSNTQIVINSEKTQTAQFQVYNALGAVVHNQQVQLTTGKNNIDFTANELNSGVYHYSIITNAGKVTKSMLIAK
jgi:hypothetical protein